MVWSCVLVTMCWYLFEHHMAALYGTVQYTISVVHCGCGTVLHCYLGNCVEVLDGYVWHYYSDIIL